ncbi:MAG: hypothetical protein M3N08_07415 [Pseudomonadota bacterium]|nr:hypothetical protein [Pseudomonadota bacterium]
MADPISSTSAITAQLRAQLSAPLTALKSGQPSTQDFVSQLQKAGAPAKPSAVPLTTKSPNRSGNLPRGSLVDITA